MDNSKNIKVSLKFYGYLADLTKDMVLEDIEYQEGASVREILEKAKISPQSVGFISVNGSMVDIDYKVANGDFIKIYPLVIGG